MAAEATAPLLRMDGIDKSFPGVLALRNVRFDLYPGEVHALMGENGAGKSTLIRVLAGAHRPDAGTISIAGQPVRINSPRDAEKLGISVIYQEFNLVPTLSARENLFLGREKGPFLSPGSEHRQSLELFGRLNVYIDPEARCSDLTVAQQQAIEIAKAISLDARILVMDEPTASLTSQETEKLFQLIRELKRRGIGIIYVSHRMEEIFRLADRVTVMRDGQYVATRPTQELNRQMLIEMMVGRKLENEFPKEPATIGEDRLVVNDLRRSPAVKGVSFTIKRGEVLGLTGLVGAGRTELARLIFGADRHDGGAMLLDGRDFSPRSPKDAIDRGICLITEDRKAQGLVLAHSARDNFALPNLNRLSTAGFIRHRQERDAFAHYIQSLRIKIPHQEEPARNLSGGNQQKLVLAKWLQANSEIVLFDEPTRGIDVGAKHEIYLLINRLAKSGKAILMISSELPEVLGMSDRILVMHEGRITGQITEPQKATQEQLLALAMR
ncbi:MAG TPA: sugar ABC transporter ATP-binding protein [Tepidisphaeraceae bacterium]|jgi:ABC-type sugar transport system ATPase subunit|nr:sugar ABC transporter ATP-binding protein [Tepidisphaeraceae bacterium]